MGSQISTLVSTVLAIPLGILVLALIPTVIIDIVKKKFYWSKFVLIGIAIVIVLSFLAGFLTAFTGR